MEDKDNIQIENNKNLPTYYVGIGTSAGGLEALEEFFQNIPNNSGLGFIVVQHLSPDYKSMMVELLVRRTNMEVCQIEDGMLVEANKIYLIPPKKNLTIYHGQLFLTEQERKSILNLPIDIFFRSLAIDQMKKAIGIILSGTGSDGTLGIKAIKEQGGLVMVQDFTNAKFDGMPKSALATGLVDYVLDANKMGDALVKFVNHINIIKDEDILTDKTETDLAKILSVIRNQVNIDFSFYKPRTIIRRIERRINVNQLKDSAEYIKLLLYSKDEVEVLAREFLIGVTQFFRDKEAYMELEEKVIPFLFEQQKTGQPIRLWSVGCSTGEEAYSLAILCNEFMEKNNLNFDLKVFATDLDKEAIRVAGLGIYPESIVVDVTEKYLSKYFIQKHGVYQVNEKIRQMVIFANHNITSDPPFSNIKLVVCRNLLIYFKSDVQQKVLNMFQYSLTKGGFLFLGSSESIMGVADTFDVVESKWKIFKYKQEASFNSYRNLVSPLDSLPKSEKTNVQNIQSAYVNQKNSSTIDLYEQALACVSPVGVILDNENTIIHYLNDVQKYLSFPKGRPNYNFIDLLNPQLTMIMSNILHKVRKEKQHIKINKFKYVNGDTVSHLNLSARLIIITKTKAEYVLITIEEAETEKVEKDAPTFSYDDEAALRIKELERELKYRDENLQTTIEELETSNEELQATNEELVSSNEELQSTNEELQSVNEELYTVNSQYQQKISELTELNNDINNLLNNTNIGTLFLDKNMIIRKFTSVITETLNIMDVDVGRPFSHITSKCNYPNLHKDVENVLDTLVTKEEEVHTNNDQWYLIKIRPYRHTDNSIHGILISQINITALHRSRVTNMKLSKTVEQNPSGIVITDKDAKIEYINPKFTEISGYSIQECIGKNPNILKSGKQSQEFYKDMWDALLSKGVWKGVFQNRHKNGHLYWEENTISTLRDDNGKIIHFVAIKQDITEQKGMEEKYQILFQNAPVGIVQIDKNGYLTEVNEELIKILGYKKEELLSKKISDLTFPEDIEKNARLFRELLEGKLEKYNIQKRYIHKSGKNIHVNLYVRGIREKSGNEFAIGIINELS